MFCFDRGDCSVHESKRKSNGLERTQGISKLVLTFMQVQHLFDDTIKASLGEAVAAELVKRDARLYKHATWATNDANDQSDPAKRLLSLLEGAPMADDDRQRALVAAWEVVAHRDALLKAEQEKSDPGLASYDAERPALPKMRAEACAYPDSPLRQAHGGPASNAFASRSVPDPLGRSWPLLRSVKNRHEFPRSWQRRRRC